MEYFVEDKNLFEIFNQSIKGKSEISKSFISVGIYANEIEKRFEFLEKLKKYHFNVFEIYFPKEENKQKYSQLEEKWQKIKLKLIFKNKEKENIKIENNLHYLLINILIEIKTNFGNFKKEEIFGKEMINKIKEKLIIQKISEYFAETIQILWNGMLSRNHKQFVQDMLNFNEKDETLNIQKRVIELRQMKGQIELGQIILFL